MRIFAAVGLSILTAACSNDSPEASCSVVISYAESVTADDTGCVLTLENGSASLPIAIGDAPACPDPSAPPRDLVAVDCQGPFRGLTCTRSPCPPGYVVVVGTSDAARAAAALLGVKLDEGASVTASLTCHGKLVSRRDIAMKVCPL